MCEMASLEAEDPWILYFICLFIVLSMQAVNVGLEEKELWTSAVHAY